MNKLIHQKQIRQQRLKQRKMIEQGKKYVFYQLSKLWSAANKKREEEEYKEKVLKQALQKLQKKIDAVANQKQQEKMREKRQEQIEQKRESERAISYIKNLFVTNNPDKKVNLPPCVRIGGKSKPAYMKNPNLDAIRHKHQRAKC